MSAAVPTSEPSQIRAGETLAFTRSFSDYPANDGWALTYYLRGNGLDALDITASADGADFSVEVDAATTSTWKSGVYDAIGRVSKAANAYPVWVGKIEVLPDLAQQGANYDTRSQARRIYEALLKLQECRAGKAVAESDMAEAGKFKFKSDEEIQKAIAYWEQKVINEERKAGRGSRVVYAQFSLPT